MTIAICLWVVLGITVFFPSRCTFTPLSSIHNLPRPHPLQDINAVALSPDDNLLVTASADRTARLWRMPNLLPMLTLKVPFQTIRLHPPLASAPCSIRNTLKRILLLNAFNLEIESKLCWPRACQFRRESIVICLNRAVHPSHDLELCFHLGHMSARLVSP
jgi:hypothetical protein